MLKLDYYVAISLKRRQNVLAAICNLDDLLPDNKKHGVLLSVPFRFGLPAMIAGARHFVSPVPNTLITEFRSDRAAA